MKKTFFYTIFITMFVLPLMVHVAMAQNAPRKVVDWNTEVVKDDDYFILNVNGQLLEKEWHIWSIDLESEFLIRTQIEFDSTFQIEMLGDWMVKGDVKHLNDEVFGEVSYYTSDVHFSRKFILNNSQTPVLTGYIISQACNASSCLPPVKETFTVNLQ